MNSFLRKRTTDLLLPALGAPWILALALLPGLVPQEASAIAQPDAAPAMSPVPALRADQIVERSVAAHGGAGTWKDIESLLWVGHIESERMGDQHLKFSLEEKRPNKTRFDIISTQPSVRIFNGTHGWKMASRNDGPPRVEAYSDLEDRFAREAPGLPGLGGPLISWREQGRPIVLVGRDRIEDRDCYVLAVTLLTGGRQTVWVDAETFLELRFDRPTYGRDGRPGMVSVYFRDYKIQGGLQVPTVVEIGGGAGHKPDRLVIERLAINPEINEQRFTRPPSPPHSHEITIPAMPAAPPPGAR